jgi:HAD superfamily hydrolase (TIGR01509 family)
MQLPRIVVCGLCITPMSLQIPNYPFQGYIFDCDGTLVDSMPLHYVAWTEALQQHAAPFVFTEDDFYGSAGVKEQDVVRQLNARHGSSLDPVSVDELKMEIFARRIPELQVVRQVAEFARSIHRRFPMAVASGSAEPTVRASLEATGLIDLFPIIITPERVKHGKPAPDMFLLAAELMGVSPSECLVLEDGNSGLEAAKAAGMQAVFIPRTLR